MVKRGRKEFVIELEKLEEFIKNEVKVIEGFSSCNNKREIRD